MVEDKPGLAVNITPLGADLHGLDAPGKGAVDDGHDQRQDAGGDHYFDKGKTFILEL